MGTYRHGVFVRGSDAASRIRAGQIAGTVSIRRIIINLVETRRHRSVRTSRLLLPVDKCVNSLGTASFIGAAQCPVRGNSEAYR
jgi:hypothetical protein